MILASHGIIASSILQVDADWLAYYNRVVTAGGSLTTTEQNATKTLVADLKANSLWTPMKAIYPMVGASAAACAQNLKSSSFTGTFTSGWTFASTGVKPNGSSAYMNSNLTSNVMSNGSTHMSYYSRTNIIGTQPIEMGTETPDFLLWFNAFALTNATFGSNQLYTPSLTDTRGFLIGSKYTTTQGLIQFNSTQQLKTGLTGDSRSAKNIFIGAVNTTGTSASYFSTKECAFASIGDGLNNTQASNLYTAVQAMQTTLSRNV
jgi:hypothetical protein